MVGHRRARHLRALTPLGLALVGLALGACASAPPTPPRRAAYLRAVEERVAAAADGNRFSLRHNPVTCDCPPFEVLLGQSWQRVELVGVDPDDATVLALEAAIEARPEAIVMVEGKLEADVGTCGRGALYVSFVPSALVDDVPAPASSD